MSGRTVDKSQLQTTTHLTPANPKSPRSRIPSKGERALICGQTGSGKTSFAIYLLEHIEESPIVIYDTKHEPKFDMMTNSVRVHSIPQLHEAVNDPQFDYVIFTPPIEDVPNPAALDSLLWMHYAHLPGVPCYVDEIAEFHSASGRAGKGLMALLQRGRSKGITFICSTQRPKWISRSLISETQRGYIFRLKLADDRDAIGDMIPDYDEYPNPKPHWFYYYKDGDDDATLMRPIKLDRKYDTGYTDTVDEGPTGEAAGAEEEPPAVSRHIWV
jgi:DNA helicase HerA-like ATPase